MPLGHLYSGFGFGFVAGPSGARGKDDRAVVGRQVLIGAMQPRFIAAGFDDGGLGIVRLLFPAAICARSG